MNIDLDDIKKSKTTSFVGEVFYEELKFIIGDSDFKEFWIKSHGMNSRAFSKDVLDITSYSYVTKNDIKEAFFIHLSRNSIYHQLPEIFFHPLVISNSTMTNREVVGAIRENKKAEEENIHFFIPFDTEFFKKRVALASRYLNIFTNNSAKKNLFSLANKIISKDIPLSKEQYYKLFLNLCNAESLKENLPKLEELLLTIMGYPVKMNYEKKEHFETPFVTIGEGILGYTFGTQGSVISEFEDVCATMITKIHLNYKTITQHMKIIKMILEFFVFSNRDIQIKYQTTIDKGISLGNNYLGYNTVLSS